MCQPVSAAINVTFVVTDEFGVPLDGCSIAALDHDTGDVKTGASHVHLQQLAALDIDAGEYSITIACGATSVTEHLELLQLPANQVVNISVVTIGYISERQPPLVIDLLGVGLDLRDAYVRMVGIYSGQVFMAKFDAVRHSASLYHVGSGSYIVSVSDASGKMCQVSIDMLAFTKHWLVQADRCSLQVDHFAHAVTALDQENGKKKGWYAEMRKEMFGLNEALKRASEKSAASAPK